MARHANLSRWPSVSEACRIYDIKKHIAQAVVDWAHEIKLIQRKLASIICHMPNGPKDQRPPKVLRSKPTINELICNSNHTFLPDWASFSMLARSGKLTCVSYNAACNASSLGIKTFLQGECMPFIMDSDTRIHGTISINNAVWHFTHKLILSRNTYVCTACGFRATERLSKLKDACQPNRKSS